MSAAVASTTNDMLAAKTKCAELELIVAQRSDEIVVLKKEVAVLAQAVKTSSAEVASKFSTTVRDEVYQLQKEMLSLTEQKNSLEMQLTKSNETIATLQRNVAREVQRARDEVERQSMFLRSQLLEQKEINTGLQEKVITAMNLSKNLQDEGLHDLCTESILITSDAVFHKFRSDLRATSHKGKYDVSVDFNGRHLVLSGRKLNVQLLKAEVLEVLNELYASMIDPTKYVSAAKAKEEASRHEMDHLRRTISTHEATIASLHVALQHAQDKTQNASRSEEDAERKMAVLEAQQSGERNLTEGRVAELHRTIETLKKNEKELDETARMALESVKAEAAVSAQYRVENSQLRAELNRLVTSKELSERTAYVASEQLSASKKELTSMAATIARSEDLARRLFVAEQQVQDVELRVSAARRESHDRIEKLTAENAQLLERQRHANEEVFQVKQQLRHATLESEALRSELASSRELVHQLRTKLVRASIAFPAADALHHQQQPHQQHGSSSAALFSVSEELLSSGAGGGDRRIARLEEENAALHVELQQAFEDIKAVAQSLKETRLVRERALETCERLEGEKNHWVEERQRVERQAIEERMVARQKATELELQILTLKDEVAHQKRRIEMLHIEYQKRISQQHGSVYAGAANQHDEGFPFTDEPLPTQQQQQMPSSYSHSPPSQHHYSQQQQQQRTMHHQEAVGPTEFHPSERLFAKQPRSTPVAPLRKSTSSPTSGGEAPNDASLLPKPSRAPATGAVVSSSATKKPQQQHSGSVPRSPSHQHDAAATVTSTPKAAGFRLTAVGSASQRMQSPHAGDAGISAAAVQDAVDAQLLRGSAPLRSPPR